MPLTIAIMTGGGDCPGLNAAIRTLVRAAERDGTRVIGILNGFEGLAERRFVPLSAIDVRGVLRVGGTVLGSSTRLDPFLRTEPDGSVTDLTDAAREGLRTLEADAVVMIGGDGTHYLMHHLRDHDGGPRIIGIPKTIDNDVHGTDYAIGFDTCADFVTDAVGRMHATAASHQRVILIEVMGRTAGWVALYAGLAGGADAALLPEVPYTLAGLRSVIERRNTDGRAFTIIVVAEGIGNPQDAPELMDAGSGDCVSGRIADALRPGLQQQVRSLVLGHLQRGGDPTGTDRVRAMMLAHTAYLAAMNGRDKVMAALRGNTTTLVDFDDVVQGPRLVPLDHPLLRMAMETGVYVGE